MGASNIGKFCYVSSFFDILPCFVLFLTFRINLGKGLSVINILTHYKQNKTYDTKCNYFNVCRP